MWVSEFVLIFLIGLGGLFALFCLILFELVVFISYDKVQQLNYVSLYVLNMTYASIFLSLYSLI